MNIDELLEEYADLPEFVGMVLDSVNCRGGFSSYPLHIAIYRGRLNEVMCLLENGANPNMHGEEEELPLQVASRSKRQDMVDVLVAHGADPDLVDRWGRSCRETASKNGILIRARG